LGDDGARRARHAENTSGRIGRSATIAEHESTAIVYGMPKEAIAHGGV
jgi:two-component system chemotaxis response regulator CheB